MLADWNNNPRVDMLLHSDTLFWFQADQSLLLLLNPWLAEKRQIPILIVLGLTRPELETMIYRTRGEHANHYITDAVKWNSNTNIVAFYFFSPFFFFFFFNYFLYILFLDLIYKLFRQFAIFLFFIFYFIYYPVTRGE